MSKVKNVSGGPLDVPLLGRQVEDGETVEVPDFQPDHSDENPLPIVWPSNRWLPVTETKAPAAAEADGSTTKADA